MTAPSAGWTCPGCRAVVPARGPWRPFCSERCKLLDLGAWLAGRYRLQAEEDDDEAAAAPAPPNNDHDER